MERREGIRSSFHTQMLIASPVGDDTASDISSRLLGGPTKRPRKAAGCGVPDRLDRTRPCAREKAPRPNVREPAVRATSDGQFTSTESYA